MYQVTVLGWLKKEKMNKSDFRLFQVCHFKELLYMLLLLLQIGAGSISILYVLLDVSICFLVMICRENANTLIGAAILKLCHLYMDYTTTSP